MSFFRIFRRARVPIACVVSLGVVFSGVAVPSPAVAQASSDLPLDEATVITNNLQGRTAGGDAASKWTSAVHDYARNARVVLLQEVGNGGPPAAGDGTDWWTPAPERRRYTHYEWTPGTDRDPTTYNVFYAQTQGGVNAPETDNQGRVNIAIVTRDHPDEVRIVENPVAPGRNALGVRFGHFWYFTMHALSGTGNDVVPMLNRIEQRVRDWAREANQNPQDFHWTVGGDFNLEPEELRARGGYPQNAVVRGSGETTHDDGGELDYFVTTEMNYTIRPERMDMRSSDHAPVRWGPIQAAAGSRPTAPMRVNTTANLVHADKPPGAWIGTTLAGMLGALAVLVSRKRDLPVELVGSQSAGDGLNYTGKPGDDTSQLGRRGEGDIPEYQPNIVLVQAGLNDVLAEHQDDVAGRLANLVTEARAVNPQIVVGVAELIPATDAETQRRITAVNSAIRALVADEQRAGHKVLLISMRDVDTAHLDTDGLSPNDTGAHKIADAFARTVADAQIRGWVVEPSNNRLDRLPAPTVGRTDIRNADPSVIRVGGTYYSVESSYGRVMVRSASSPENLDDSVRSSVWADNGLGEIWAPELVKLGDRYYIYFSAGRGSAHRMYVISSDSPDRNYGREQKLALPDDKWAIDGAAFTFDNQLWFVWSGWAGDTNIEQNLYLARMSNPTTPTGARFQISQPREPWERVTGNPFINEAPEPIRDPNGQLHIVYSANGSWTDKYCLGDLRLKAGGNPEYVWDWYKSNGCVMGSDGASMMSGWTATEHVNGPGHHSFVLANGDIATSPPAGRKFPLMYHGVPKGMTYKWENRVWYSGAFTWWKDIPYGRQNVPGDNVNTGYSLGFFEDANSPLPPPPVTRPPGKPGPPGQSIKNADPSVIRVGATYYSVESDGGNIYSRSAADIHGLQNADRRLIWSTPKNMPNLWAPKLMRLNAALGTQVYAVYFASGDGQGGQRMYYTWSNVPDRGFSDPMKLNLPDDKWSVDGSAFYFGDKMWFVWSGWEGDTNIEQNLYLAEMTSPSDVTGKRYRISQPRESWERVVGNPFINEAPAPIKDPNGQLHIVYSANGSWTDHYCIADLRLRKGGDPTYVWDWYKSNGCEFGSYRATIAKGWDPTLYVDGPGSHSFVLEYGDISTSPPAGPRFPLMYHAVPKGTPYSWGNRHWFTGTFSWWGNSTYSRQNVPGANNDTGFGLKFFEDEPTTGAPGQTSIRNADPSVMRVGSTYYSVESDGGSIYVRQASAPNGLGGAARGRIWSDPGMGEVWAPELVLVGGRYYVYFSAGSGNAHRMYVISSDRPTTGYGTHRKMPLPDDKWAVDGTAFTFENQLWFVWSGWEGDTNVEQNLYLVQMSDPATPTGPRARISQPREPWERRVGNPFINEAPAPIKDPNGQLHITYSANGSWSDQYCIADLRLRKGGDPTYVWDWYKSNGCQFGSVRDSIMDGWDPTLYVNGPGSHSFVLEKGDIDTSPPAGPMFPMMYHAVPKGTPYSWANRLWHTGTFCWWGDSTYSRQNVPGANSDTGWGLKYFE
ncbi:family 43 glycosylhydrolase [Actinokineospora enzanensis]|uniref:family 43 glycosylhydrolase n=1 Tax=Actinokineospora enzanensis TaxID=155975 RepID=UPI001B7F836E|nr:family 43 glycosylhydrolase [Actinokineospora enzanensis]